MSGDFGSGAGRSRYFSSMTIGPCWPRVRSSRNRPRRSHAFRNPAEKHSERNAKMSNMVDLPLPLGLRFCKASRFKVLGTSVSRPSEAEMSNNTFQAPVAVRDPLDGPCQRRAQSLPEYRPTGFADGGRPLEGPLLRLPLPRLRPHYALRQ